MPTPDTKTADYSTTYPPRPKTHTAPSQPSSQSSNPIKSHEHSSQSSPTKATTQITSAYRAGITDVSIQTATNNTKSDAASHTTKQQSHHHQLSPLHYLPHFNLNIRPTIRHISLTTQLRTRHSITVPKPQILPIRSRRITLTITPNRRTPTISTHSLLRTTNPTHTTSVNIMHISRLLRQHIINRTLKLTHNISQQRLNT